MICDDKAAHYDILNENKVPCFIHKYFFALPIDFKTPLALLKKYKKIVVKQNNGTGGKNIYKVCNEQEMYDAINNIAAKSGRFSISPFYEYEYEYRIILLNGKMKLCYKKIRPVVIGDGKKAIKDLIQPNITPTVDLEYVPKKNEVVQVS
jgi:glutathione synthase/RimK-type ligase-like ATP-grasp enzyme